MKISIEVPVSTERKHLINIGGASMRSKSGDEANFILLPSGESVVCYRGKEYTVTPDSVMAGVIDAVDSKSRKVKAGESHE